MPSRPSSPSETRRSFVRDLLPVAAALTIVLTARSSLADHYHVPTGSMRPTVEVEDRVLVNKLAYGLRVPFSDRVAIRLRDPQPGDVVVLDSPEDGKTLLKRVVGVPGDVVRVRGGRIERNGQRASVTLSPDGRRLEILGDIEHPVRLDAGGGPDFGPVRIPTDSYLVVGDDRGRSHDGRSFGLVARDAIRGRAVGVLLRRGAPVWHAL